MTTPDTLAAPGKLKPLPLLIFSSRWLQLPLYVGLIVAQCVYVFLFYLILALALLTNWVTIQLRRLPIGRAWEALREDGQATS